MFGSLFFFKQKTAYEMRISDWSSDVCSSDLDAPERPLAFGRPGAGDPFPRRLVGARHERRTGVGHRPARRAAVGHSFGQRHEEIGRASCRARVCQYVYMSVGAVSLKKKIKQLIK